MRSKLWWGHRALVALGALLLAIGGAAVMGISPAAAVTPRAAEICDRVPAPTILRGSNGQAGSNITFSLLNDWSGGTTR